jgi:hypothetical protein
MSVVVVGVAAAFAAAADPALEHASVAVATAASEVAAAADDVAAAAVCGTGLHRMHPCPAPLHIQPHRCALHMYSGVLLRTSLSSHGGPCGAPS